MPQNTENRKDSCLTWRGVGTLKTPLSVCCLGSMMLVEDISGTWLRGRASRSSRGAVPLPHCTVRHPQGAPAEAASLPGALAGRADITPHAIAAIAGPRAQRRTEKGRGDADIIRGTAALKRNGLMRSDSQLTYLQLSSDVKSPAVASQRRLSSGGAVTLVHIAELDYNSPAGHRNSSTESSKLSSLGSSS